MKKILVLVMALVMALSCVSFASAQGEVANLTFFSNNAMAGSGSLSVGHIKFFEERGLSIEVIPFSTEKMQAQLASGDLADIIWLNRQEMLIAAESGLILALDDYIEQMPNIVAHMDVFGPSFTFAREYNSNGTGNLYYFGQVGPDIINVAPNTERHAIKMNWPVYADAGYPEFSTLEGIIPVLKQMQEIYPVTADGLPTYGMNLFSDFDTERFWNMTSIYSVLGKLDTYLGWGVEFDPRTQTGVSIFAEGSVYYRGLKFMYEMNQAGLIDPDSLSQTRSTAWTKIDAGAALAGWSGNPGWETGGYYPVVFDEFIPSYTLNKGFGTGGYCISANCKNIDAALKFLDTLANEEDLLVLWSGYPGDDMKWNYDENGVPTITQAYIDSQEAGVELSVEPERYVDFWNIPYLLVTGYILECGTSYSSGNFPSSYEYQYSTPLAQDWSNLYGYKYLKELLTDKDWPIAAQTEGFSAFLTPDDDDMVMTKAALKDIIVPASWRMVFANSEDEFETIWNEMKTKCESLGINDVIEYKLADIANARIILATIVE